MTIDEAEIEAATTKLLEYDTMTIPEIQHIIVPLDKNYPKSDSFLDSFDTLIKVGVPVVAVSVVVGLFIFIMIKFPAA